MIEKYGYCRGAPIGGRAQRRAVPACGLLVQQVAEKLRAGALEGVASASRAEPDLFANPRPDLCVQLSPWEADLEQVLSRRCPSAVLIKMFSFNKLCGLNM